MKFSNPLSLWYIFIHCVASFNGDDISMINVNLVAEPSSVKISTSAKLRCTFKGREDMQLQYIAWYKVDFDGQRTFVHEYTHSCDIHGVNRHSNRAYNDLVGRSSLRIIRPLIPAKSSDDESTEHSTDWRERDILRRASAPKVASASGSHPYSIEAAGFDEAREPGKGEAILQIANVRLQDEAKYECVVKTKDHPAFSDIAHLVIIVLPSSPVLTILPRGPYKENDNITLTCECNVGRPAGTVQWFQKLPNALSFREIPEDTASISIAHHSNGTSSVISSLAIILEAKDDKSVFKCVTQSRALRPRDPKPSASRAITVYFPPKKGKILFDAATGRYYCYARGSPRPDYVWLWHRAKDGTVTGDEEDTIMSTTQYLDISNIQSGGHFLFKCLASNVIKGERNTVTLETELNLSGPSPSTTLPPPTIYTMAALPSILSSGLEDAPLPPHIFHHLNLIRDDVRESKPINEIIKYLDTHRKPTKRPTPSRLEKLNIIQYLETNHKNDGPQYYLHSDNFPLRTSAPKEQIVSSVPVEPPSTKIATPRAVRPSTESGPKEALVIEATPPQGDTGAAPAAAAVRRSGRGGGDRGRGGPVGGFEEVEQILLIPNENPPTARRLNTKRKMGPPRATKRRRSRTSQRPSRNRQRSVMRRRSPRQRRRKIIRPKQRVVPPLEPLAQLSGGQSSYPMILPLKRKGFGVGYDFLKEDSDEKTDFGEYGESINEPYFEPLDIGDDISKGSGKAIGAKEGGDSIYHLNDHDFKDDYYDDYMYYDDQDVELSLEPIGQTLDEIYTGKQPEPDSLKQGLTMNEMDKGENTPEDTADNDSRTDNTRVGQTLEEIYEYVPGYFHFTVNQEDAKSQIEDEEHQEHANDMSRFTKQGPNSATRETMPIRVDLRSKEVHTDFDGETVSSAPGVQCTGLPDGAYGGGCRAFYRCIAGIGYSVQCHEDFAFNRDTATCTSISTTPAPCGQWRDCQEQPDGKYPDFERWCRFYYTCHRGRFLGHNECNPGLVFNAEMQVCDWPMNVQLPCGTQTEEAREADEMSNKLL